MQKSFNLFNFKVKKIESFLHADSDSICFGLTTNLLYIFTFAGCPLAVVLVKSDTLHLAPTVKFSKLGFPKYF